MAETIKSYERRKREGFFDKYIKPPIIDIGCAGDMKSGKPDVIDITARMYDKVFGDGDAQTMQDIPDESFMTVYASHILEHLPNPIEAIRNWFRILKPGGYLIIDVPSMVLYEKQSHLPSRWNGDHKTFWLLNAVDFGQWSKGELPFPFNPEHARQHVRVLGTTLIEALEDSPYKIESLVTLDEGFISNGQQHSAGEYSYEAIIYKLKEPTEQAKPIPQGESTSTAKKTPKAAKAKP